MALPAAMALLLLNFKPQRSAPGTQNSLAVELIYDEQERQEDKEQGGEIDFGLLPYHGAGTWQLC